MVAVSEVLKVPMRRIHVFSLLALTVAVPAATAGSFFGSDAKPCFAAGHDGYTLSGSPSATHVVRVDNNAANPNLRMQLVDDAAIADFVLVDDSDADNSCTGTAAVESIGIDSTAAKPDLTVVLSRQPADYKIYVHSTHYTAQDAAALFAVIWQKARNAGSLRAFAKGE
jgi:hypothetical protein